MIDSAVIWLILFAALLALMNFAWAGVSAAPWVPSRKKDMRRVLELAEVQPGDVVYDLGSGDGRWLFYFAENSPAGKITGFEISYLMFFVYCLKKLFRKSPRVSVKVKNLYKVNLAEADIILCFLMPNTMKKLVPKFTKEMKKGAKLISYAFTVPGLAPQKTSKPRPNDITINLYRF